MPSFADLGVPAPLCATLARRGITEPFPVQAATLPDALAGRDVAGQAPTGSGKTLAFGLAIAARAATGGRAEPRRPRALVLVPTRELAAQVQRELAALIDERAHGPVAAVYGGVGYGPQRTLLARGVSALVACPGRLEDLLARGDVLLDAAGLVVLDEADRMADMGFLPAVRRLLARTPAERQMLLFSATLDGDVDVLVRSCQHAPVRHAAGASEVEAVEVTHRFWTVAREDRVGITAEIAKRTASTIVFTRTRHGADRVTRQLGRHGVKAVAIHGRRSQAQRDLALRQFSTGRAPVLVATDVAARGIHVDAVGCVVHFDLPDDPKDYVHRSGRTGRAGATGTVVALVGDDREAARALRKAVGRTEPLERADPDALGPVVSEDRRNGAGSPEGREQAAPAAPGPRAGVGGAPRADRPGRTSDGAAHRDARRDDGRGGTGGNHERRPRPRSAGRGTVVASAVTSGEGRSGSGGTRRERRVSPAVPPRAGGSGVRGGRERAVTGTVSSYNPRRGYGFIALPGGGDVFVHVSALPGDGSGVRPGQRVRFELGPGKRGQQARNVRLVG